MRTDSLLIESEGKRILVDAGYGDKLSAKELAFWSLSGDRLPASLEKAGLGPEQIDVVVNTHLHADHCGWQHNLPQR